MAKQTWTAELLTDFYREDLSRAGMQRILEWAIANDRFDESEAKAPLFSILGRSGRKLFAVFSSGHIYVWFEEGRFEGGTAERDLLVAELKSRNLLSKTFDITTVKQGKTLSRTVGDIDSDEVEALIDLMGRF